MLGFRQGISSSDSLEVFLDFFNTGVALTNTDSDFLFNSNISALKYKIEGGNMVSVGVEEQNERYITMVSLLLFSILLPIWWWSQ